jgi:nitroimidazol reductase NimA-like FMN-containing flavoprotein (pyridoxamine 5'-phosphate oxidase superfamily)
MPRPTDRHGLVVLERDECLRLLATGHVGRIGTTRDALPTVLPVTYTLDGDAVVFRAAPATTLEVSLAGMVVAFEVDEIDPWHHEGWSVVVQGFAHRVTDHEDVERLRRLPLTPWAPGRVDDFVVIPPTIVTGRRLERLVPPGL